MYSVSQGQGPPLVLLHGLFGSLENLAGIGRILARDFAVTGFDLPHHGRSLSSEAVSLRNMADALADALDQRFGGAPVSVLGHSLGGKVAMEAALLYPQLLERLIVLDIAPKAYERRHELIFSAINAVSDAAPASRREADGLLRKKIPNLAVRSFLLKNWQKQLQNDGEARFAWRCNMTGLQENYDDLVRKNTSGVFAGPVYFLCGEHSDYVSATDLAQIKQRFPSARVEWLADTEHWLHAEKPLEVATRVKSFLVAP